jgi:hypothetical protein
VDAINCIPGCLVLFVQTSAQPLVEAGSYLVRSNGWREIYVLRRAAVDGFAVVQLAEFEKMKGAQPTDDPSKMMKERNSNSTDL